jgi:hypothetical protein
MKRIATYLGYLSPVQMRESVGIRREMGNESPKMKELRAEYPVIGEGSQYEKGPGLWETQDDFESYQANKKWFDSVNKCRHTGRKKRIETDSQDCPLVVVCDDCAGDIGGEL